MPSDCTVNPSAWRKSSYSSGTGGECVEVADSPLHGILPVRDSKDPQGAHLLIAARAWAPFVTALKEQ